MVLFKRVGLFFKYLLITMGVCGFVMANNAAAYVLYKSEYYFKEEVSNEDVSQPYIEDKKSYAEAVDILYKHGTVWRSFNILKGLADKGVSDAKYLIFRRFWGLDTGLSKNDLEQYLREAAEDGYADAQYTLGLHYMGGFYEPKDKNKTLYWIEKSAVQDYPDAMIMVASQYFEGEGVEKNNDKGFEWLMRAYAAMGRHFDEWGLLGKAYENGLGTPVDLVKAYMCYDLEGTAGREEKERIAPLMTPEQRSEGLHLSREWQEKNHVYTMQSLGLTRQQNGSYQ